MEENVLKFNQICLQATRDCSQQNRIVNLIVTPDRKIVCSTFKNFLYISGSNNTEKIAFNTTITCISSDSTGKYILISGENGLVQIIEIPYKIMFEYTHDTPITASQLDPNYAKNKKPSFIFSDSSGKIYRYVQSFFSYKTCIFERKDYVVKEFWWGEEYIAWASQSQIVVIAAGSNEIIIEYNPKADSKIRSEPNISFSFVAPSSLFVSFKNLFIELHLDRKKATCVNMIDNIITLSYNAGATLYSYVRDKKPYLVVDTAAETTIQTLKQEDPYSKLLIKKCGENQFILLMDEKIFELTFVGVPERLQRVMDEKTYNDIISWLRSMLPFLSDSERLESVILFSSHLIDKNETKKAGEVCSEFLDTSNADEWSSAVSMFDRKGALAPLSSYVPVESLQSSTPQLMKILKNLMEQDTARFFAAFESLPLQAISNDFLQSSLRAKAEKDKAFNIPLMRIYHGLGEHSKGFDAALSAGYLGIFADIERCSGYEYCRKRFHELFMTFGGVFSDFLVKHSGQIPPARVMELFGVPMDRTMKEFMFRYLDSLRRLGQPLPAADKAGQTLIASLFIEFRHPEAQRVLKELMQFDYEAVRRCAMQNGMFEIAAELCLDGGAAATGIKIHLERVKDPAKALAFAVRANQQVVWDALLEESARDGALFGYLVRHLHSLPIFIRLLEGAPEGVGEGDITEAAGGAIREFERQKKETELIERIIAESAFRRFEDELKGARRGVRYRSEISQK